VKLSKKNDFIMEISPKKVFKKKFRMEFNTHTLKNKIYFDSQIL